MCPWSEVSAGRRDEEVQYLITYTMRLGYEPSVSESLGDRIVVPISQIAQDTFQLQVYLKISFVDSTDTMSASIKFFRTFSSDI